MDALLFKQSHFVDGCIKLGEMMICQIINKVTVTVAYPTAIVLYVGMDINWGGMLIKIYISI